MKITRYNHSRGESMDANDIRKRITQLRLQKNISERKLSKYLGWNDNYIQDITSGKSLPSMVRFLQLCDYFGVTPKEFFDDEVENPAYLRELIADLKHLDAKQLEAVHLMVKNMKR